MRILADENIPGLEVLFDGAGEVVRRPGRAITRTDVREAEVLLVRSVTRVDAALLRDSRVRFVGSTTSGVDHLDTTWLESAGIPWAHAPGCNARAVAEYVFTAVLGLCRDTGRDPATLSAAVIGLGEVGRRVATGLAALGLSVSYRDPAVADARWPRLADNNALADYDVVTWHVPLTRDGPYATYHALNAACLKDLKPDAWLINTARGAVWDNRAVVAAADAFTWVMDVWEGEPVPATACLTAAAVATPHVAGYSLEGKWRGAWQVYRACCDALDLSPRSAAPAPGSAGVLFCPVTDNPVADVAGVLQQARPLWAQTRTFRDRMRSTDPARAFDALRREWAGQREFAAWILDWPGDEPEPLRAAWLQALGFREGTA